jgi:hypothetical protein
MEYRCFWSDPFDANDRGPQLHLAPFGGSAWQASWQTRQGLRYQLEVSPDLVTWLPAGSSVVGTGGIVNRGVDPGAAARIFYRLSCPDASVIDGDDDDDQVSAPEEGIAGTWDTMEMSDPASGINDIFKAVAIVLAAVAPQADQDPPVEVGKVERGLAHEAITEIPQSEALIKDGYFTMPPILDPENWYRFSSVGRWKPLSGAHLELQKGDGVQQPWYKQWCELDAHWQNQDRNDHFGPIAHGIEQTIPTVPCGRQLFLFFDYCRRYDGPDTVTITAQSGDPARTMTVLTYTAPGGWERIMVPLKIPKPAPNIISLPLCLRFDIGDGLDSYGIFVDNIELIAVDIVPDDGMVGVVGDVVPSVIPGSTVKHFVTPKKSAEIAQDFVLLKATGLNAVCFGERFTWEGGDAGASADKQKVSRAATGMTPVEIKTQQAAATAAQMDVWVVWAEGQKVAEQPIQATYDLFRNGDGILGAGLVLQGEFDFKFTISPASIIRADEFPDLRGLPLYQGMRVEPPGAGTFHVVSQKPLNGGVCAKWDVSRRIRIKSLNPKLYPKGQLSAVKGSLWDAQPVAVDTPASFPADTLIGNDDATWAEDEDNNPYVAWPYSPFAHAIGEISSSDAPNSLLQNSTGADGDTFEVRYHFGEFSRLLIGGKWYRISEFLDWRAHYKMKRNGGVWADDGSEFALDNANF